MSRVFSLACLWLLAAMPAFAADPVFPPGSRIGLVPPADMEPARGLTGFRNPKTGAAILAIEMPPDAYPSLAATFTDPALKEQGFTLSERASVPIGATTAILITGRQSDGQGSIPKSLLLAGEAGMTALVVGQLQSGASPAEIASVQSALRTVAFRPPLRVDEQVAALPFTIGDRAGFRPIRAAAGNSLLMTDGPEDAIRAASQPVMIVAQSFAPAPGGIPRETFARQALAANTFFKDAVIERSQAFRQAGADWHELVAKASELSSGTAVVVVQTIRFQPDSYLRAVGIVKADQRDGALPRFRRIVDSVAQK